MRCVGVSSKSGCDCFLCGSEQTTKLQDLKRSTQDEKVKLVSFSLPLCISTMWSKRAKKKPNKNVKHLTKKNQTFIPLRVTSYNNVTDKTLGSNKKQIGHIVPTPGAVETMED